MDLLNFTTNTRNNNGPATTNGGGSGNSSLSTSDQTVHQTTTTTTTNTQSSSPEDQTLKECETYVNKHNVKELLKDCIVQLCLKKPDNPISFLRQHFERLDKVTKLN